MYSSGNTEIKLLLLFLLYGGGLQICPPPPPTPPPFLIQTSVGDFTELYLRLGFINSR